MKIREICLPVILGFLCIASSCGNGTSLTELPYHKLEFSKLPESVKIAFRVNLLPTSDSIKSFDYGVSKRDVVNLDSTKYTVSYESTGLHGMFPGNEIVKICTKEFYGNRATKLTLLTPFVLFEDTLYCLNEGNIFNNEDLENAIFVRFSDLDLEMCISPTGTHL